MPRGNRSISVTSAPSVTPVRSALAAITVGAVLAGCSLPFDDDARSDASTSESSAAASSAKSSSKSSSDGGDDAAKEPATVTVTGSGDILVHVPVRESAKKFAKDNNSSTEYDFDPIFAAVKKTLSDADVSICHQETPISATNDDLSRPGSLVYNVPKEIAPALKKAGYDGCETASNHVWDRGATGIDTTNEALKKAGLKVAGPVTAGKPKGMPAIYDVKGVKVANLSYSYSILNQSGPNTALPPGQPQLGEYLWPKLGVQGILADAKKAKASGADLVVVSMHWGTEYEKSPTKDQSAMAKQLLASPDVDGIFGAHAHLIQPCQSFGGKTVFYGLGNFLSNQGPGTIGTLGPDNADGAIAKYTFTRGSDGKWTQKASFQPTMVHRAERHEIELSTPKANPDSYKRTVTAMGKLGSCSATPEQG